MRTILVFYSENVTYKEFSSIVYTIALEIFQEFLLCNIFPLVGECGYVSTSFWEIKEYADGISLSFCNLSFVNKFDT